MNRECISYERDIHTSYMKVPALEEDTLDVRIMLQRKIKGLVPVECCFINGKGEYWYNISGKQDLDTYTKLHALTYKCFELLILQICEQLELLEWNLLDGNGLQLHPQYIYINREEEFSFVYYPSCEETVFQEFRRLLEFLLTKLDHTDTEAVQRAYELYEISLSETYQIEELKTAIISRRLESNKGEYTSNENYPSSVVEICKNEPEELPLQGQLGEKLSAFCKKAKLIWYGEAKETTPIVVYPKEEEKETTVTCPTICIGSPYVEPRGVLVYEGGERYSDFELDKSTCVIGKSNRASMEIHRDTISHFHAKIEYEEGYYIEDMNSTNGTFVNDEIVNYRERRLLHSGDVIRFADVKYRFL